MKYDLWTSDIKTLDTVVDVDYISTYPVYLKLWNWATNNYSNFNEIFPEFKEWEFYQSYDIYRYDVNEKFGADVIKLVRKIYLSTGFWKTDKIQVEATNKPATRTECIVFGNCLIFNFIICANSVVLCNFKTYNENNFFQNTYDYLGVNNPIKKAEAKDSHIKYVNQIWFINSNIPFMAYPNGIINDKKPLSKGKNYYFFEDFVQSYFTNPINIENEWYSGRKSVISYKNPQYHWDFIEDNNNRIVIIIGFNCNIL